jgi:hypothetical protein
MNWQQLVYDGDVGVLGAYLYMYRWHIIILCITTISITGAVYALISNRIHVHTTTIDELVCTKIDILEQRLNYSEVALLKLIDQCKDMEQVVTANMHATKPTQSRKRQRSETRVASSITTSASTTTSDDRLLHATESEQSTIVQTEPMSLLDDGEHSDNQPPHDNVTTVAPSPPIEEEEYTRKSLCDQQNTCAIVECADESSVSNTLHVDTCHDTDIHPECSIAQDGSIYTSKSILSGTYHRYINATWEPELPTIHEVEGDEYDADDECVTLPALAVST